VTARTLARIEALTSRTLSADDARAWLDAPIDDDEREQVVSLIRWFRRRYPTPAERLAYARIAYVRWRRATERAASAGPSTPHSI
jgi:hypothetical protein